MTVAAATAGWRNSKAGEISGATHARCAFALAAFDERYGKRDASSIQVSDLIEYRTIRLQTIEPSTVNLEIQMILNALAYAGRMLKLRALRVEEKSPGRVMTAPEKEELLRVLVQYVEDSPAHRALWLAVLIALNTGLRRNEVKHLLWEDIHDGFIHVRKSKTSAGIRRIPINDRLKMTLDAEFIRRGFRNPSLTPAGPVVLSISRDIWRSVTAAAGVPGLRFHDLRHQVVTELLEKGVPEQVIREIVGHVSPRMMEWYAHTRVAARKSAMDLL